jgi:hypothetical protein
MKNISPLAHALAEARTEIARLKAREAEMRAAIVGSLVTLRSSMGNTNKVMYTEAKLSRTLLARESAEPDGCPRCGAPEVAAETPRTVYACGSSDYDQRPGTFDGKCAEPAEEEDIPNGL